MRFADIHGLSDVKARVQQHIASGTLAHAYLLRGEPGSALLPISLAWGAYLFCTHNEKSNTKDACGTCSSCRQIKNLTHPDLHLFFPARGLEKKQQKPKDESKKPPDPNKVKEEVSEEKKLQERRQQYLEHFRAFIPKHPYCTPWHWHAHLEQNKKDFDISFGSELLISRDEADRMLKGLKVAAFTAPYKIVIVWGAEYLRKEATNAILKTVESPSANTLFFFLSYKVERLWPTLLSRLHPFFVRAFTQDEASDYLIAKEGFSDDEAQQWAAFTEGDIQEAIQLRTLKDNIYPFVYEWLRSCWVGNYDKLLSTMDVFSKMSFAHQQLLLRCALRVLRATLLAQAQASPLLRGWAGTDAEFITKFGRTISYPTLHKISKWLGEFALEMSQNINVRVAFLGYSIQIQEQFKVCRATT